MGTTLAFLSFVPYFLNNTLSGPRSRSGSWGLTSFWRILLDLQSGKSIIVKVQHVEDYALLNSYYQQFDAIIKINYFVIALILLFSIQHLVRNFYNQNITDFLST